MRAPAISLPARAAMPEVAGVIDADGARLMVAGHTSFDLRVGALRIVGIGRPGVRTAAGPITSSTPHFADRFAQLWKQAPDELPASLQGAFALVAWHAGEGRALVSVDRFASHALYWGRHAGRIAFGTRPVDVAQMLGAGLRLSDQALYAYLYFHVIPAPLSIADGVARFEMGEALHWQDGGHRLHRYWQPVFDPQPAFDFARARSRFFDGLRTGVRQASEGCRPDEVGCFLSGGTDSSTLAGILGEVGGRPARSFSIVFDDAGADERVYSRRAARHFGCEHTEYQLEPDDCAELIAKLVRSIEQPFGNASVIPTLACARLAQRAGVRRMLGGDGGDELFGGNTRYATAWLLSHYARLPPSLRTQLIEPMLLGEARPLQPGRPGLSSGSNAQHRWWLLRKACGYVDQARLPLPDQLNARYNLLNRLVPTAMLGRGFLAGVDRNGPLALERRVWAQADAGEALINRLLRYDFKFTLADNDLVKVTRMCEAAGVSAGFPMLDPALVSLAASLPATQKLRGLRLRVFFRAALRGYLPDAILDKPKHGFAMPFGGWLLRHPSLASLAFDCLHALVGRGLLNPSFVDDIAQRTRSGDAGYYGTMVWVLMALELWLRESPFSDASWPHDTGQAG